MPTQKVKVNRAPVLTLWTTVVAERLGHNRATALTLGKALAGLNAQSKGRRLGIFKEQTDHAEAAEPRTKSAGGPMMVTVLGRPVPTVRTPRGVRATVKGLPIEPESVQRYLEKAFGGELADVQAAMEALAKAYPADALAARAYALYEKFRPAIPEGKKGWGAKGELNLDGLRSLARKEG